MKKYKTNISNIKLVKEPTDYQKVKIGSSHDASEYCRNFFNDDIEIFESFFLLLLNRANNTTGYVKISQGGCAGTVIDIKLIAKYSVDSLAGAVILCHNHPSGNKKPSTQDIQSTKKIKEALSLFDIPVLDHIILTADSYTSLADEGMM